jgi:hypothetical protein
MRYIGVLHDVKATEKSIAAGGRDSIKDSETGVSDTYGEAGKDYKAQTVAALKEKIAHLSELVQKNKTPGAAFSTQKLALLKAHTSKLAVYAETIEVANILKEMLDDIKLGLRQVRDAFRQRPGVVTCHDWRLASSTQL